MYGVNPLHCMKRLFTKIAFPCSVGGQIWRMQGPVVINTLNMNKAYSSIVCTLSQLRALSSVCCFVPLLCQHESLLTSVPDIKTK